MDKPRHVFVCVVDTPPSLGPSCGGSGSREILNRLPMVLLRNGITDVKVVGCGCLGACGGGANLVVYPEGILYRGVTVADLEDLVVCQFVEGQPYEALAVAL